MQAFKKHYCIKVKLQSTMLPNFITYISAKLNLWQQKIRVKTLFFLQQNTARRSWLCPIPMQLPTCYLGIIWLLHVFPRYRLSAASDDFTTQKHNGPDSHLVSSFRSLISSCFCAYFLFRAQSISYEAEKQR